MKKLRHPEERKLGPFNTAAGDAQGVSACL